MRIARSLVMLMILSTMFLFAPSVSASDWQMVLHDSCNTGYTNETVSDELELLWSCSIQRWWDLNRLLAVVIPEGKMTSADLRVRIADGKVVVIPFAGKIYTLNADTGKIIWSYPFGGLSPSVAIADGKVFVSFDKIYALDADTGKIIWSFEIENAGNIAVADGKIFVSPWARNKIYVLDEDTGNLIRIYEISGPRSKSIAIAEGKIFVKSETKIYVLDEDSGKIIWSYEVGKYPTSIATPIAIASGKVFFGLFAESEDYESGDSKIYALDADTGDLIWCYYIARNISGISHYDPEPNSIAVAHGKVFVGTKGNKIYSLDADAGNLIWSYEIEREREYPFSEGVSSVAIADKKVFAGTLDKIYALDADTGEPIWSYKIENGVFSIAIASGKVFVGTCDNKIYCFGAAKEEKGVPGFEAIFAIAGLLVVAYILRRRK